MPAANQFRLPALRISSMGVLEQVGGRGDSTSSILKSPLAARGTGFVFRSTNGAMASQISVAKTLRVVVPPGVTTSAVPMVSPPANTRPRPSTLMCPSTPTSALKAAIAHNWAGGCTPRTMFRLTVVATGHGPGAAETPSAPIAPLNVTSVSSVSPSDGISATRGMTSSLRVLIIESISNTAFPKGTEKLSQIPPLQPTCIAHGLCPVRQNKTKQNKAKGEGVPPQRSKGNAMPAPGDGCAAFGPSGCEPGDRHRG